ncbi:MAG: energy-coupling factor transporter transmembrane protein EcfT, partial [Ureaplasma sp.]|nr:energy-coupling factor transporter transmembrane protein EcfT [Ureaplasma sp.]
MFQESSSKNNSLIHRLNPTLKFISFVFIIIMIFLPLGFFAQIILLTVLLTLFIVAKIKRKVLWNIVKSVFFLFLILFIINWFLYKNPIAMSVDWNTFNSPNGFFLGNKNWINTGFLVANNTDLNNTELLVSQVWGGTVGINGSSYLGFNDTNLINEIAKQNNFTTEIINQYWDKNLANHSDVQELFKLACGDETLAKQYYYLINNSWTYNGLSYDVIAIKMMNAPSLEDIKNLESAQAFIRTSYYMIHTNWYTLSPEAIQLALYVSIKVFLMILAATLLTSTTNSIELTYALENVLSPLKLFRLPVAEASMMIAIALRFIPSLLSESNRIMNAQASRGVDFKNGNFVDKLKSIVSLVVPLFSIAFKKAEELANAMDARSYNPRYARTKYRKYVVNWYDWIAYFALILLFGAFVAICKFKLFFTPFNLFELSII